MIITYCRKCNHFYTSNRISNYCKSCKAPTLTVDMEYSEFYNMDINDRYKLAYKLTAEYDKKFKTTT